MRDTSSRSSTRRIKVTQLPLHHVEGALAVAADTAGMLHQVQRVAHRRQRVAQLVREHREELVLLPVGLGQLVDALAQLVLQALALGDVAHDAGEVALAAVGGTR